MNGKGTLITTEECLLSKIQQRNSGFKKHDYEKIFFNYFGIRKIIWLKRGIVGDDTHGHIDDLARFVSENTIFLAYERNKKDVNYKILRNKKAAAFAAASSDDFLVQATQTTIFRHTYFHPTPSLTRHSPVSLLCLKMRLHKEETSE